MVKFGVSWVQSPYFWGTCLVLVLAGGGAFLLSDLGADPLLGPTDLEGQMLLDARGRAGEAAPQGNWAPALLAPLYTHVNALSFRIFGVNAGVARSLSVALALFNLLFFYRILRPSLGAAASFLSVVFLVANPVFFSVARTALPPVFSLFWMLLAIRLWIAGARSRPAAFASGIAWVMAGLVENGPHALFFLFSGLFMLLLLRLHGWKMAWHKETHGRLSWVSGGASLTLGAFVLAVITHWDAYGATWGHFWGASMHLIASNLIITPRHLVGLARYMPLTMTLALGYFLFFAKDAIRPVARHRKLDELRLWLLAWLVAGFPFFTLIGAPPLHALVLLLPPLCALAAESVVKLLRLRTLERPRIDVMIVMTWIALSVWIVVASLVHTTYLKVGPGGYWGRHNIQGSMLIAVFLWMLLTYVIGWLYLRWRKFKVPLQPGGSRVLALVFVVGILGLGLFELGRMWDGRTHEVERAREYLGELQPGNLIVGSWAPLLTLGTPAHGTFMWPGVNDNPEAWHGDVTHVLVQMGRESERSLPPMRFFLEPEWERIPGELRLGSRILHLYRVRGSS